MTANLTGGAPEDEGGVRELAAGLNGDLVRPGDARYDELRSVFNAMIERRPAVIVRCADVSDIVLGVTFARTRGMAVSIKGGGHSVAGSAVCEGGVMLDLSGMKEIVVDPDERIARAEPGLTLGEFDAATHAFGLATTMGVVSMTGIAGLTLGGGIGWLNGKYGLACDNLLSAEVVLADGQVVTASDEENPDLFWGLRGGGGNFGVVASFTYRLHPVRTVLGAGRVYSLDDAAEVLAFYDEFSHACPDDVTTASSIGPETVSISVCYCGPEEGAERAIAPLREFGRPIDEWLQWMPYPVLQSRPDPGFPSGWQHYWKSGYVEHVDPKAAPVIAGFARGMPSPDTGIGLQQVHGAAARVPPTATAFPHRRVGYDLLILSQWERPEDSDENIAWTRALFEAMSPFTEGRVYVNNLGAEEGDRVAAAYAQNYARLAEVKRRYDPTNFFRLNHNVAP
jgi:FAD/FMN-containing dehydrogenase